MRSAAAVILTALAAAGVEASSTQHFVLDTAQSLSGAVASAVAVGTDGSLRPLAPLGTVASFDEPLGLAMAVEADGSVLVGTGHPARLWRVHGGAKTLVADVAADQVTALLTAPDGEVFVSTAAPALLLRLPRGGHALEQVSKVAEGTLWDLAWFKGNLIAAAGNPGRLMRLGQGGLEVAATVPDQHARCLAVSGDTLLVGTSGKGLLLRWTGEGKIGAFFDSSFTEIAALTVAPDGTVYAAALTGEPTSGKPAKTSGGEGEVSVTVSTSTDSAPQTDHGSATAEILQISPQGAALTVHRFDKQLAYALAWNDGHLVIGTGLEGELWQVTEGAPAELDTVDAAQVVRLAGGGAWVLTQGPVKLLHRSGTPRGTISSPPLDADQPALFGATRVSATVPDGASCAVAFRSGATERPDETWSDWSAPQPCGSVRAAAPRARFLQWRLALDSGGKAGLVVTGVDVAYRQINLPPQIEDVTVHEPAVIFVKGPPPSDRVIEAQHPGASGIFTTLSEDDKAQRDRLGKKYYRVGYQTLSWKVEDPNHDALQFDLDITGEGSGEWWPIRKHLDADSLAFDTEAVADGRYRCRLTATDAPDNPDEPATSRRISGWFTVDNTPPRVEIGRAEGMWVVTVSDALSPLFTVQWNRDAKEWHDLVPVDGLLDSREETFHIPAATGRHVLAVRAMDDHYNRATAAVEEGP
jgi:hypothetical protein